MTIKPYDRHVDLEYFVGTEYDAALEAGMLPASQDDATRRSDHRKELLDFVDGASRTGIFVAEDGALQRIGLVWVAERARGEAWDLGPSVAWIYDIRVDEAARRKGLGSRFLMQAEAWAQQAGYPAIGLHVFGTNTAARALYASAGYTAINTYVQKTGASSCCSFPAEQGAYTLSAAISDDTADIERLAFESFWSMARHTWPDVLDPRIREGYEELVQAYSRTVRDDVALLVRDTVTNASVGAVRAYASSGDLGPTKYVWIRNLVVAPGADPDDVSRMLLGGIARWAAEHDLDVLRTSVHACEPAFYDVLVCEGFEETNVFLRKVLGDA